MSDLFHYTVNEVPVLTPNSSHTNSYSHFWRQRFSRFVKVTVMVQSTMAIWVIHNKMYLFVYFSTYPWCFTVSRISCHQILSKGLFQYQGSFKGPLYCDISRMHQCILIALKTFAGLCVHPRCHSRRWYNVSAIHIQMQIRFFSPSVVTIKHCNLFPSKDNKVQIAKVLAVR